jgi:type IV secretory pathway TraG/TraD family ATPase VirD4
MPTNDRMLSNTRAIASVYLNTWSHLRDRGEFSVRDWVRGAAAGKKTPWLYLVYRDDQMALLRLLIATWLDLAIVETLGLDEQPARRIWFVMDEADSLGKVASLRDGLTKLRKYGGAVVAGLQTIAQLRSTYGRDEAQVLLSCLSSKLVLAAGDAETARYFEQELGTQEIERVQVRQSDSRQKLDPLAGSLGKSAQAMRSTQATVLASEISRLPNLHGFLVTGGHPIVRVTVPYQDMAIVREPFVSVPQ